MFQMSYDQFLIYRQAMSTWLLFLLFRAVCRETDWNQSGCDVAAIRSWVNHLAGNVRTGWSVFLLCRQIAYVFPQMLACMYVIHVAITMQGNICVAMKSVMSLPVHCPNTYEIAEQGWCINRWTLAEVHLMQSFVMITFCFMITPMLNTRSI